MPSRLTRTLATYLFVTRYRTFAGFLFVLTAVLGWFVFLHPAVRKLDAARAALFTARVERIAEQQHLAALHATNDQLTRISVEDAVKLRASIPSSIDLPWLWTVFDTVVTASGMELGSITVSESAAAKDVMTDVRDAAVSRIEIVVRGSGYSTFKRLLQNMEESTPIMRMREWTFAPEREEFTLLLDIFTLADL